MEESGDEVASHALAEAEQANRNIEQRLDVHPVDQFIFGFFVLGWVDSVDVSEQIERFDYWEVPPELGALAEHDSDSFYYMGNSIFPRDKPIDFAGARVGI